jgi:hypothetical protein
MDPHWFGSQDPNPEPRCDKKSQIRIRMRMEPYADPQHWLKQIG